MVIILACLQVWKTERMAIRGWEVPDTVVESLSLKSGFLS